MKTRCKNNKTYKINEEMLRGAHEVQPRGSGSRKNQERMNLTRVGRSWHRKHENNCSCGHGG